MVFKISSPLDFNGINSNIRVTPSRYGLGYTRNKSTDSVEINSVGKFTNETYIRNAIKNNPEIKNLLPEINEASPLNMEELQELQQVHAKDIRQTETAIINNLPESLKAQVNKKSLYNAAFLHDIGKVLIPKEILNKPDKLTAEEHEIMKKHSQLGYELLKNSGTDAETLSLIKYHHQNALSDGYPLAGNDFKSDINLQILNISDKYSALIENRPYKKTFSPQEALTIIYTQDVKSGKIHPFVFNALSQAVNKAQNQILKT